MQGLLRRWFRKKPSALPPGPDLALIKEFAEPGDRESTPVFVGRKEEIGIVEKIAGTGPLTGSGKV